MEQPLGSFLIPIENEISVSFRSPSSLNSGYYRFIVKPQAQFALYFWSKSSGGWQDWWAAPVNACAPYGRCGAFGLCSEGNVKNEPTCGCFRGSSPPGQVDESMSQRREPLMLCVCAALLWPFLSRLCHGGNTLSPGQALKGNHAITSSGGNFTLGFFSLPTNNSKTTGPSQKRYLGIWYATIPEQTVVWVANRDNPVPADDASGGSFEFAGDGDLVVLDGKGRVLWSTNCSSTNDSITTLEDNGNLVLHTNSSGVIKWQSFSSPSDTMLSGMDISFNIEKMTGQLWRSWKSHTDPSSGSFAFGVDPKNVFQCVLWNGSVPVWRTAQWTGQSFSGIPEMSNSYGWAGGFRFVPTQNGIRFEYREPSLASFWYTRFVVKPQGQLALYSWQNETGRWVEDWAAPVNACATYGRCGPSSVCSEGSLTQSACSCLPGFKPSGSGGCVRSVQLGCRRDNSSSNKDDFKKVASVKPPDGVLWLVQVADGLDECRTLCSKNCSCTGHALDSETLCMMWFEEDLVDMQQLASGRGMDFYVRVAPDVPSPSRLNGELLEDQPFHASTIQEVRDSALPLFDLKTIMAATDDFATTNKLGEGGFGPVYKGLLPGGQEIAVKRLSKSSRQGFEEFMNEVEVIAKLQHKNLVRLLGCCVQGEEKILVYEYMPNKSLDFLLFGLSPSLSLCFVFSLFAIFLHRQRYCYAVKASLKDLWTQRLAHHWIGSVDSRS
ncbi:G-type lectin S-receptor-like serine/threonine-protein kinase [Nymphaea thermarum]|nr:G-type lectin S-receptor-like serine/threonine-protein kinase [Nymphaea thermarum]